MPVQCRQCGAALTDRDVRPGGVRVCGGCGHRTRKRPPAPDGAEQPRSRPKTKKARAATPPFKRPAAIVGVAVAALLAVGGVVVLVVVLLAGGGAGGTAVAAARPAQAVVARIDPDPPNVADWAVTPDPVEPAGGNVGSVFLVPSRDTLKKLTFADPAAGKAVTLDTSGRVRYYDLAKPPDAVHTFTPPTVVKEPGGTLNGALAAAPSPAGDRIALVCGCRIGAATACVAVCPPDGREVSAVVPLPPMGEVWGEWWAGFVDANTVLVHAGGQAYWADVAAGKVVRTRAMPLAEAPALTGGRRWLYGRSKDGFDWFDARTGDPAGRVRLPSGLATPMLENTRARLVADPFRPRAYLHLTGRNPTFGYGGVAVIDTAAGRVVDYRVLKTSAGGDRGPELPAASRPDGLVQFWSGHVYSPDAGGFVARVPRTAGVDQLVTGPPPDGRHWRIDWLDEGASAKVGAKDGRKTSSYLLATSVPVAAGGGGAAKLPFPPGTPLRVVAKGYGGAAYLKAAAEDVAAALAARGYPIDPAAPDRVEFAADRPARGDVVVGANAEAGKQGLIVDANNGYVKRVSGLVGEAHVTAVDAAGKSTPLGGAAASDADAGEDVILARVRSGATKELAAAAAAAEPAAFPATPDGY